MQDGGIDLNLNGQGELSELKQAMELGSDVVLVHAPDGSIKSFRVEQVDSKIQTINDCLYYYNIKGIEKKPVQKEVKDPKTGKTTLQTQYKDQSAEDKKNKVAKELKYLQQNQFFIYKVPENISIYKIIMD